MTSARFRLCAAFFLAVFALTSLPARAEKAVATIVGAVQGQIRGDETSKSFPAGSIALQAVRLEMENEFLHPTTATIHPFRITKLPDRATPGLLQAALTGENLNIEIRFFRTATTGAVVHYHT